MDLYRVLRYEGDARKGTEHLNVEATDAMKAAVAICGAPLVASGEHGPLCANVAPMDRPVELRLFYRPPA